MITALLIALALADSIPAVHLTATPTIVGPGVISTLAEEFKATVSPDGRILLYVVADHRFHHMTIVESHRQGAAWGAPEVAAFSGVWRDGDPAFAPDGRTVLFITNRPYPGEPPTRPRHNFNMWRVERRPNGTWGSPVPLGKTVNADTSSFAPSLSSGGVLYFSRGEAIYRVAPDGAPEMLPIHGGGDPAISADERFLVFDDGNGELLVSCRTPRGWAATKRFDVPPNAGDPWVTANGRWMYFYSTQAPAAPDRTPRAAPATYADIQREVAANIYNGSRNLYQLDLSSFTCGTAP
jgi:Tol biopolymer transport system component